MLGQGEPDAASMAAALAGLQRQLDRQLDALGAPEVPRWGLWLDVERNTDGEPVRHRVAKGGRGGAKSRTFARKLLIRGTEKPLRILCTREFQRSIRDSVHRLLRDEINRMNLGTGPNGCGFYQVFDQEIRGRNGTLFIFHGLHRNENGIKSLEGIDIAWVEEARSVSQRSIDVLIPTIRKEGSEIWWSYNPYLPTDPVDKMFYGGKPPPGTVLIEVHWSSNKFFPDVLKTSMEHDRKRDPDKWAHIWQGAYVQHSEAKVFKNWRVVSFDIPSDAVLRHGADWGFATDPTVLVQSFIGRWAGEPLESDAIADPHGRVLFVAREAWEVGCPVDQLPALFAGDDTETVPGKERWTNPRHLPGIPGSHHWQIIADSARPELIAYMVARGFNIVPAVKGPGSLEQGVTFLQSYDIAVHPDCHHTSDELTHYSYKLDELTGTVLPVLADKDNHVIDALRYSLEAVRRAGDGKIGFARSGPRVMLPRSRDMESEVRDSFRPAAQPTIHAPQTTSGRLWASAPSLRRGLLD